MTHHAYDASATTSAPNEEPGTLFAYGLDGGHASSPNSSNMAPIITATTLPDKAQLKLNLRQKSAKKQRAMHH